MQDNNSSVKVIKHSNKRIENFNKVYSEACELIRKFEVREIIPVIKLKEAAEKLIEAIDIDESRIEPYLLLSEIFFNLDNRDLAFKYLKIAREIEPEHPVINNLKNRIIRHYLKI